MKTDLGPPGVSERTSMPVLPGVIVGTAALAAGLSGAVAALAGFLSLIDRGFDDPSIDLCGNPQTGFYSFWDQHAGVLLLGLAVLLIAAGVAMIYIVATNRQRMVAGVLVVVTLSLCPIPWVVQIGRQSDDPGCHQL